MAQREQFKMSLSERRRRHFSIGLKQQKVREIERGETKISEICRQYEVSSVSVYNCLEKYGSMQEKKDRIIIEIESDTKKHP